MKVSVTKLKAPWPQGVVVGSVVEFEGGSMPAWAIGKCVTSDAEAEFSVDSSDAPSSRVLVDSGELAALREFKAGGERAFSEAGEQHRLQVESLQAALSASEQALLAAKESAEAEAQALRAQVADLTAKLEAATKPAAAETKPKAKG